MGSNGVIIYGVALLGLHHPHRKDQLLISTWRYLGWEGSPRAAV